MGLFDEIEGEIEAFSCFKKPSWLKQNEINGVPWRGDDIVSGSTNRGIGSRQHGFKSIWEQSLDPRGENKHNKRKSSRPENWSIDWKKWPPNVPRFPKGIKIPIALVPQVDLRLSMSGRWDEITHGKTVIPVNYESKKFFDNLGGHLNIARSATFKVIPSSLLFLHTKVGQFYTVKLKLHNMGNVPRRVRILPPANSCFTVIRHADPKESISPGWCLTVEVRYRPKTNNSVNDSLVFIVDRDGSIVVPLISSSVPEPILEVEEWNCGCCVVGIPRTANFEIKNLGGEGRFWILSEHEFNNEYLESYLKFKKNLIRESTREMVKLHKEAMDGNDSNLNVKSKTIIGRGEALGLIKRRKDSMDEASFSNRQFGGKIQPRIYTKCFRIQPSCFHLQRNQRISIKVRYLPKDANFHYEKLCIMCENGEVRWIAVKGLGIERDSDKLIEVKALWSGPPVDLPSDPRTKYVMDCGDLIAGELAKLNFTIVNKSCIPLYFFWCVRPVLTDPEASPEKTEASIMDHFYEATIYDPEKGAIDYKTNKEEEKIEDDFQSSWGPKFHFTITPAQGMLEKKQESQITFAAHCPPRLGYHACVISLFVEQVDEESKSAVLEMLRQLDAEQINRPISHVHLTMELPSSTANSSTKEEKPVSADKNLTSDRNKKKTSSAEANQPIKKTAQDTDQEDKDYVSFKDAIKEYRNSLLDSKPATRTDGEDTAETYTVDETLLPKVVARRSSLLLMGEETLANLVGKDDTAQSTKSNENIGGGLNVERKESINIHFLGNTNSLVEQDREVYEGHGVYEELKNYTENIVPQYKLWPNREKILTPVAEVEIWLHSVPLDVTFSPPFLVVNGLVKTSVERLIKVKNGSNHNLKINFDNICDDSIGAITCHPQCFSVKPHDTTTFKVVIYFEKYGEMQRTLCGKMKLPFTTTPCFISTYIRAYGPYLEVLNPTINFGIVPLSSETMKTLALRNGGDRPLKWVARIAPEGLEDEHKREISGHQARIHDKRLVRIWPEWGVIEPGESAGMQVYFCAELSGQIASYVEVMVEGNPESVVSVPLYGEIELPSLVLENALIQLYAEDFAQHPVQNGTCTIINPTGFNVPFAWQCPVGRQSKLCSVYIHPKQGIIPAKARLDFSVCVEALVRDEPLELENLFVPCCVEGMREPLILKIFSEK